MAPRVYAHGSIEGCAGRDLGLSMPFQYTCWVTTCFVISLFSLWPKAFAVEFSFSTESNKPTMRNKQVTPTCSLLTRPEGKQLQNQQIRMQCSSSWNVLRKPIWMNVIIYLKADTDLLDINYSDWKNSKTKQNQINISNDFI